MIAATVPALVALSGGAVALIALGIVVVVGLWAAGIYNKLVSLRERSTNAFAQIDVQLKRRYDLIPNLVETAKGYMAHERETLEAVINARNQAGLRRRRPPPRSPAMPPPWRALGGAEAMLTRCAGPALRPGGGLSRSQGQPEHDRSSGGADHHREQGGLLPGRRSTTPSPPTTPTERPSRRSCSPASFGFEPAALLEFEDGEADPGGRPRSPSDAPGRPTTRDGLLRASGRGPPQRPGLLVAFFLRAPWRSAGGRSLRLVVVASW